MNILSSIFHVFEKVTADRAHVLAEQVVADQAVSGADYASRLKKLEDLSFLRVTMFA